MAALAPQLEHLQLPDLEASLRSAMHDGDRSVFRARLTKALRLHPSEPVLSLVAATEAVGARDRSAPRWLNRAMQQAPGWAGPHVLTFQWLMRVGRRPQAAVELRTAAAIDPLAAEQQLCDLVRSDVQLALQATPNKQPQRGKYLEMAGRCVEYDHPASAPIDDAILRESPRSVFALQRKANRVANLEHDLDGALRLVDQIIAADPHYGSAYGQRAWFLIDQRRFQEAIDTITRGLPLAHEHERGAMLTWKARAQTQLGDTAGLAETARELRHLAGSDVVALARSYAVEAESFATLHRPGEAFRAYREAYRLHEDVAYLESIARIATGLGDRPQALWAYVQLCRREPTNLDYCRQQKELMGPSIAVPPPP
jgi:tetratricopeptide (TPR) repeat protein